MMRSLKKDKERRQSVSYRGKYNYSIGNMLSVGNYAVVRDCRHKSTNENFVLKVINKAKIFGHEDLIEGELEITRKLRNHQSILQLVDEWESSDDIFLVLESIEV